jgi:diadenosine tetraphosphate (Ap4A) HIT family hydrolase
MRKSSISTFALATLGGSQWISIQQRVGPSGIDPMGDPVVGCSSCAEISAISAPGGVVFEDGLWIVSHHANPFSDPGELIVRTRRHCESLSELSAPESLALGPILQAGVSSLERVTGAERVYAMSFNERVRHVHFLLLPRAAGMPRGHIVSDLYRRARNLLRRAGVLQNPSRQERAYAAEQVRIRWRGTNRAGNVG